MSVERHVRNTLGVNLAEQSPSRLIELCLLYRVHHTERPNFPERLKAEIARRYTEAALRNGDTEYSVLKKFLNEFKSPIPYAHQQLMEMSASVNRDIWFSNNESQFKAFLENQDILNWLVEQSDILGKCLNNRHALKWIAQSSKASTAILTHRTAVNQWKQADGLWSIWQYQQAGMEVLAQSRELVNYVLNLPLAWNAINANTTAVTALAGNTVAMEAICANQNAITHLVANSSTWAILLNSQTAMNAVIRSEAARNALMNNNTAFQNVKETLWGMVNRSWQKKVTQGQDTVSNANSAVITPAGLVFAVYGVYFGYSYNYQTQKGGNAVSFNGCTFTEQGEGYLNRRVVPSTGSGTVLYTVTEFHGC